MKGGAALSEASLHIGPPRPEGRGFRAAYLMTKKDSEKDSERPHYYSQFWLDVAAGRKVIGAPKTNEEAETVEPETIEPVTSRKAGRNSAGPVADGHKETRLHAIDEPIFDTEEFDEPELDELDEDELAEVDDIDIPNIAIEEPVEDTNIPNVDLVPEEPVEDTNIPNVDLVPEEPVEEETFEEEFEEDEEDLTWGAGRGRKKPKPGRQAKPPSKKPKRDRRSF